MRLSISEILEKTTKLKTKNEKIEYLHQNDTEALRTVLQFALHPGVKSALPEGTPPYKPCQQLDQEGRLYAEYRRLYLFCVGGHDGLKPLKRETLFIGLLESIDPKDAELLCAAKDKKLPYEGFTVSLLNEAFPGILPEEIIEPEPVVKPIKPIKATKVKATKGTTEK